MLISHRGWLRWLLLAVATLTAAGNPSRPADQSEANHIDYRDAPENSTRKRFVVEFHPGTNVTAASARINSLPGNHVVKTFDDELFRGVSVETDKGDIDSLKALDAVLQTWPSRQYTFGPIAEGNHEASGVGSQFINYSIHHMTGVDRLHTAGSFGQGARVAVVDTGVDYTHPALGGGFGPGFTIAGGYDFAGDGIWLHKMPDNDPKDLRGHGTHVAGIIAGNGSGFLGVAPRATLYVYKVFTAADGTNDETLIEAFLRAYSDGVDIITSSIGQASGWADGPWARVANRLVDKGVVVTIAAGNDGQAGPYSASDGSSGSNVLAIASVEADRTAISTFRGIFQARDRSSFQDIRFRASSSWNPENIEGWPIVTIDLRSTASDACVAFKNNITDLSKKIVLIQGGNCTLGDKLYNLAPFNVSYVLVSSSDNVPSFPVSQASSAAVAGVSKSDGQRIVNVLNAGGEVTASFRNQSLLGVDNTESPGAASSFTSIGPTNDLFIKSDIAAPGGRIWSTYLNHGFALLDGTSMACPYVAGVAALYVGKFGGRRTHGPQWAKALAMRIMSSGEAIRWDDGQLSGKKYSFLASVAQVGTGLINATKVFTFDTELSLTRFALNDTAHLNQLQEISITNTGKTPVTYTFSQQKYGAFDTITLDSDASGFSRVALLEETLTKPFEMAPRMTCPEKVVVDPAATQKALCTFLNPVALDSFTMPVYSGKTVITGSNGDVLGVPYLGLAADLNRDIGNMFQHPIGFPTIRSGINDTDIAKKTVFSFDLESRDYPRARPRLQYATRELRWDIFGSNWSEQQWRYPPEVGIHGFVGSIALWRGFGCRWFFSSAMRDAGPIVHLPLRNLPRDLEGELEMELCWAGRFADGSLITPGKYQMRLAALRPFGDGIKSEDWDVFETPEFTVQK